MSKFYKDLAGEHYETLAKAIYRKEVRQVTDPSDLYLPLLALPRSLLSWLIHNVKPLAIDQTEQLKVPGSDCILHVTKMGSDLYKGQILRDNKIIHTFEPTLLPALGGHLLNVCELYEEVAGRPVDDIEKEELSSKLTEKDELRQLINKLGDLVDKISASNLTKDTLDSSPEKQTQQPVVVNVTLSNIGNSGSAEKEVPTSSEEEKLDKEELDKGAPASGKELRDLQDQELTRRFAERTDNYQNISAAKDALDKLRSEKRSIQAEDPLQEKYGPNYITARGLDPELTGAASITLPNRQGAPTIGDVPAQAEAVKRGEMRRAKDIARRIHTQLKGQEKPDLPKAELDKAKEEYGHSDRQKRKIREERRDAESGPTGTTENFHPKGKNTPMGQMNRRALLRKLKAQKKPDLPKSELNKEELDKAMSPMKARLATAALAVAPSLAQPIKQAIPAIKESIQNHSIRQDHDLHRNKLIAQHFKLKPETKLVRVHNPTHPAGQKNGGWVTEAKRFEPHELVTPEMESEWDKMNSQATIGPAKKAELNKKGVDEKGMKAAPMQPQKATPPQQPTKGAASNNVLNQPKDTAAPMPKMSRAPKMPKTPKMPKMGSEAAKPKVPAAQKQMQQAMKGITKQELDSARSDTGERMFVKEEKSTDKYKFNPTGVHAVMTKDSMLIKKNEDDTYNIFVNGKQWDVENVQLLMQMVKLRSTLKNWGV